MRMERMFAYRASLKQIKVTARSIAVQIGVYTQKTQQLHHKDKMEIGISLFNIIEQRERPVEEREQRLVTAILTKSECKQFGKI